ncbi:MAG: AbrB/MazE/SpoVT family DNA-binding domain-containing protein [Planctomycetota bacterium]|nr:AbrB/MazE/SpoVT family DNA-binding domain-containing protein [Planctomycetota bacterium]
MRVTSKGQVTIPIEIRERFGFVPDTDVEFVVQGKNTVILRKAKSSGRRGRSLVEKLRGKATVRLSTDEILALTRK